MKQKKLGIIIAIVIVILLALAAYSFFGKKGGLSLGGTGSSSSYQGKLVSVDYVGSYPDGEVFDTNIESVAKEKGLHTEGKTYTPLQFVVGSGMVVPGFEKAIAGMKIGETKKVTIAPAEAYGEYDEKKIITIPNSLFQEAGIVPKVGDVFQMGQQLIQVKELKDNGEIVVDTNHPMAGKTLVFDITLKAVEDNAAATDTSAF